MISDEWRTTDVIPIYKGKGSKYDVGSYRPISLSSTISKVMESIIYSNIVNHCNKFNIIIQTNMVKEINVLHALIS